MGLAEQARQIDRGELAQLIGPVEDDRGGSSEDLATLLSIDGAAVDEENRLRHCAIRFFRLWRSKPETQLEVCASRSSKNRRRGFDGGRATVGEKPGPCWLSCSSALKIRFDLDKIG